jgi:hypothetical protein
MSRSGALDAFCSSEHGRRGSCANFRLRLDPSLHAATLTFDNSGLGVANSSCYVFESVADGAVSWELVFLEFVEVDLFWKVSRRQQ